MAATSQDASPPPVTADLFSTKSLLILCSSVVYCGLNYSLNFYTEYIFGTAPHQLGFQVALFFGFINFFLSFVFWTPALLIVSFSSWVSTETQERVGTLKYEPFKKHWPVLLALSLSISISTTTQNASLDAVPLTINQLVKALGVIPMLLLSFLIEGKRYSYAIIGVLAIQLLGALLAALRSRGDYTGSDDRSPVRAYVNIFISIISSAIRPVLLGYLFEAVGSLKETGFSPLVLLWYDAVFAALVLLPCFLVSDEPSTIQILYQTGQFGELWSALLLGSLMAIAYNLTIFVVVQQTSSLYYQALAQFNTVVVVGGAALFIDHIRQAEVWVGTIVCLLASTAFVYLRHREQPSKAAAAVEADAEGGGKGVEPVLSEATPLKADAAAAAGGGGDGGGCAVQ